MQLTWLNSRGCFCSSTIFQRGGQWWVQSLSQALHYPTWTALESKACCLTGSSLSEGTCPQHHPQVKAPRIDQFASQPCLHPRHCVWQLLLLRTFQWGQPFNQSGLSYILGFQLVHTDLLLISQFYFLKYTFCLLWEVNTVLLEHSCCPSSKDHRTLGIILLLCLIQCFTVLVLGAPHFTVLHFIVLCRDMFHRLKVYGNQASSTSAGTTVPTAFAHFMSLCYSLAIPAPCQTISLLSLYVLRWSAITIVDVTSGPTESSNHSIF